MSSVDIKTKIEAYKKYVNGKGAVSQSELADSYGISPRTLRRWFEDVEKETGEKRPVAVGNSNAKAPADKKNSSGKGKAGKSGKAGKKDKPAKVTKPAAEPVKVSVTEPVVDTEPKGTVVTELPVVETEVTVVETQTESPALEFTYLMTAKSVSMTKIQSGKVVDTVSIDKTNDIFKTVVQVIMESDEDVAELERAYMLCRPRTMIEVLSEGRVLVDIKANKVFYVPEPETEPDVKLPVDSSLSNRILDMIRKDGPDAVKSLICFLDKLLANPSYRAVNELWKFLSHNDIEIAPDGDFFAFKVVTSDFKDKHTRTMCNEIGTVVKMPRNLVDENSNNTCSAGLHVCARHYIKSFSSYGDKLVRVKVSPTDVVSIPKDYNDSKMRCCRYTVYDLAK